MSAGKPKTVLYAAWAPFFSGAERALLLLVEHLDPARYRPVVAVGTDSELADQLRARRIAVVHIPIVYSSVRAGRAWLSSIARFTRLALAEKAALIHGNDVPSFQPAGFAARLLRRPAIVHVRFPDSPSGYQWFLKPGFARAVFVSGAQRQAALAEAGDVFTGRSVAIHDAVRRVDSWPAEHRNAVRAELALPLDSTIVALTGQVAEIKGLWEFIDAAAMLIARGVPVTFAILGDDLKGKGALRARAERLVSERGLAEHIRFLGFRQDAPRIIPAFDIVAVPSHVEPFGLASAEAMAAGLPVVGSRVGGIPEVVAEDETGLLVPPRDAGQLAEALNVLIADPARARAYGEAGRRRAQTLFSVETHVRRVQGLYDQVLGGQAAGDIL